MWLLAPDGRRVGAGAEIARGTAIARALRMRAAERLPSACSSPPHDPEPRVALAERALAQSEGLAQVLAGTEAQLGPALERWLFPRGAPPSLGLAVLGAALARSLGRHHASALLGPADRDLDALVFPFGAPARLDVASLLRATRAAAARESAALRSALEGEPPAVRDRARRVVRLWAVASTWHALGAARIDARAARLLEAVADDWRALARALEAIEAAEARAVEA